MPSADTAPVARKYLSIRQAAFIGVVAALSVALDFSWKRSSRRRGSPVVERKAA